MCHETYPEQRSRPDNRCSRLQIALRIFSVSTINIDARRIRRFDESVEIYQSKSTSPRSVCLVRKSLPDTIPELCSLRASQLPFLKNTILHNNTHFYVKITNFTLTICLLDMDVAHNGPGPGHCNLGTLNVTFVVEIVFLLHFRCFSRLVFDYYYM